MGLKLNNEFTVAAPLERTWETLLDIGRVAHCLPGAKLESDGSDGTYRGTMKVKLGPMNVGYEGVARLIEADEDSHVSALDVKGKELKGQGTASATIRNQLEADGDTTRVRVQTDLAITGRQAQFGRGIMEDVATRMLGEFAKRLEQEVLSGGTAGTMASADGVLPTEPGPEAPSDPAPEATPIGSAPWADDGEVLDLGGVLGGPLAKRAGIGAAVAATAGIALALLRGRRRKGFEVIVRYR